MLNLFIPGICTDPAGVTERKLLLLPAQASYEVRRKGRSDMPDALTVNREHKDTVFRMLYKGKKELLTLYNALNGTDYQRLQVFLPSGKRFFHLFPSLRLLFMGLGNTAVDSFSHIGKSLFDTWQDALIRFKMRIHII